MRVGVSIKMNEVIISKIHTNLSYKIYLILYLIVMYFHASQPGAFLTKLVSFFANKRQRNGSGFKEESGKACIKNCCRAGRGLKQKNKSFPGCESLSNAKYRNQLPQNFNPGQLTMGSDERTMRIPASANF